MTIRIMGTQLTASPRFWARSSRKASEKRASVNTAANMTTHQKRADRRCRFARLIGKRDRTARGADSGSSTPKTINSTHTKAGTVATQNTSLPEEPLDPGAVVG